MSIGFPSREFDEAVAAVCHGTVSDEQARALNALLRNDVSARDEYILRLELHARLASDPDLFLAAAPAVRGSAAGEETILGVTSPAAAVRRRRIATRSLIWATAIAASVVLVAAAAWGWQRRRIQATPAATSRAVAMLNQTVEAEWAGEAKPRLGAPLEPGQFDLKSGLAEVVFYSGARVTIQGPAAFHVISASQIACRRGRAVAEVPPPARGFRLETPHGAVTDLGTSFGVEVREHGTELDVFKGSVRLETAADRRGQVLRAGAGAVVASFSVPELVAADRATYAALFELQEKSAVAQARRLDRWRAASDRLNADPGLLVHFDFESSARSPRQIPNVAQIGSGVGDATIVGCEWVDGRWPEKRALGFQGVSDRVRLNLPGEFDALTLTAWVRVQGLDRKLNALFMSDGFDAGTVHWLIRRDGVLGLTIVGDKPRQYQIVKSPPVVALDQFGMWLHLAVVIDGPSRRAAHYVNGRKVSDTALEIAPPYRVGTAELGNWNAKGFPEDDPFMIRHFSGAMDEFCLFGRALSEREIQALHADGKLELDAVAFRE